MIPIDYEISLKVGKELLQYEFENLICENDYVLINCEDEDEALEKILSRENEICFRIGQIIGRISSYWNNDVQLVFHHAGWLDEEKVESQLYRLIMNAFGHGISIYDSIADAESLDEAQEILNKHRVNKIDFTSLPFFCSISSLYDMIYDYLDIENES